MQKEKERQVLYLKNHKERCYTNSQRERKVEGIHKQVAKRYRKKKDKAYESTKRRKVTQTEVE